MNKFHFTFENLEGQYSEAVTCGYSFVTCADFARKNFVPEDKIIINRVDIDFSVIKAERIGAIFKKLGIRGSFFIRLHAPEYNPFSFVNYRIIKRLIEEGNEIGYHSEVIDQAEIWGEDAKENLVRDISVMNSMFGINVRGVASHGGMTGLNNLDFWKKHSAEEFGLLYEAYDWFDETFYISDSEWTKWKCYDHGRLIATDRRSFGDHIDNKHMLIYLLIHSDTYYKEHFYE